MYGYGVRYKNCGFVHGVTMPAFGLGIFPLNNYDILYEAMETIHGEYCTLEDAGPFVLDREHGGRFMREDFRPPMRLRGFVLGPNYIGLNYHGVSMINKPPCVPMLGSKYIDMYLIHYYDSTIILDQGDGDLYPQQCLAIVIIRDEKKLRAIEIENLTIRILQELTHVMAFGIVIDQYEKIVFMPYHVDSFMIKHCINNNILFHAYHFFNVMSPKNYALLLDPVVKNIANKYCSTPTEVLLAWALKHGIAVMPKSTAFSPMRRNITLKLELDSTDMKSLDALGVYNKRNSWDPSNVA